MPKEAYYFSHDSNARNDIKLLRVRRQLGLEGYAIYFCIIEMLREQADYKMPLSNIPDIAFDLNTSDEKVSVVVNNFELFEIEESLFFSARLLRSMDVYNDRKQRLSEAGKRGVEARLKGGLKNPQALKKIKVKESKGNKSKEILFDTFWDLYDNKKEKDKCYSKWTKLDIETIQRILQVVPMYVQSTPNKQFRKHPATWLNNKCWDDELPPSQYDPLGNSIDRKRHPSWDATYPYNETNIYYFDNKMPDKMKL